jgi:hypothetical protein
MTNDGIPLTPAPGTASKLDTIEQLATSITNLLVTVRTEVIPATERLLGVLVPAMKEAAALGATVAGLRRVRGLDAQETRA